MNRPTDPPTGSGDRDWDAFDAWADRQPDADRADRADRHDRHDEDRTDSVLGGLEDDPRVQAGIEHVQRAAHEMIAASRALLDVAEQLVDSPGGITRLFGVLGEMGDLAGRVARANAPGRPVRPDDGPDPDPPVQRIPVS